MFTKCLENSIAGLIKAAGWEVNMSQSSYKSGQYTSGVALCIYQEGYFIVRQCIFTQKLSEVKEKLQRIEEGRRQTALEWFTSKVGREDWKRLTTYKF